MIYSYRHLLGIPCSDVATEVDGRWVRAIPLPFRDGIVGRLRDALAVFTGRAYAFRWPEAGEFEGAMPDLSGVRDHARRTNVDGLVLGTVNASFKRSIDAQTLASGIAAVVTSDRSWVSHVAHVATFFFEVKPHLIVAFADHHGIDGMTLRAAYATMRDFTGERNADLERFIQEAAPSPR